ncbi:MAG: sporulation protein [Halorientalis sp.]
MGVLSRLGVGAATVETVLEADRVRPGDAVDARVEVTGGDSAQTVDRLDLAVATAYQVPTAADQPTHATADLAAVTLAEEFTVLPGEHRVVAVPPVEIPATTPPTIDRTDVWLRTGLEVDWAVDPTDEEPLAVAPGPRVEALLTALEDLGLSLSLADNVRSTLGPGEFAQCLACEPTADSTWAALDAVRFYLAPGRGPLDIEVDAESGAAPPVERPGTLPAVTVESTDPVAVAARLRPLLDESAN